ncbi:MAG: MBL fold metallo-hydrolase [Candidatus Dormibacteraeota bacterium]|nr:MBL fold metallo-hydrolase [Candidatus Dormibacteraeota bacterium]
MTPTLRLVGGPTALITYGGLRLLTDPTFDPPGEYPRPGTPIVLRKLRGPALPPGELGPVDAVLLSHDHHSDNLDGAGRALLPRVGRVLTTDAGAERLGQGATALGPGDSVELERPGGGGPVRVTAVPAEHGPPEVAARNGPVIGFVLRANGLPTTYVSGDNASLEVVRAVAAEHGPIDAAVLFAGGARVPEAYGEARLTLSAETAVEAARALDPALIVPIHQEGWAHFSSSPQDLLLAFAAAELSGRLRMVAPGERVPLA